MNIILRKDNFIAAKCKTVRSHRFMPVDIRQFLTLSSSVIIIIATVLVFKGGSRAMLLGGGGCQNCWGGASSTARSAVEQVRPRQREALAEGAAAGVWGRKNRSPRVLECT